MDGRPAPLVDLSLSTNPYGPPPFLTTALRRAKGEVAAYPDRAQVELTESVRERLRLDRGEVLMAGSASELLRSAISAYAPGRTVMVPRFTYEEYARVAISVGGRLVHLGMPDLRLRPRWLVEGMREGSLIVLANPGTPNGEYWGPHEFEPVLDRAARLRSLLVVDESYLPFVKGAQSMTGRHPNLLVVFSWSKVLGTPGLPLGHAAGAREVVDALRTQGLPWSVGPFARHLGLLAMEQGRWVADTLARTHATADRVREELGSTSRSNYFLVPTTKGSATSLARRLLRSGFRVRDLTSMGLPRHVRFAVRRAPETHAFLEHLREVDPGVFPRRDRAGAGPTRARPPR